MQDTAKASRRGSGIPGREEIAAAALVDEPGLVSRLVDLARLPFGLSDRIAADARMLVEQARASRRRYGGVDAFMHEYGLSSEEGIILMCLAEALLRIPDPATADKLIADKIGGGDWERHVGRSDSVLVNASTWGLMLTGRLVDLGSLDGGDWASMLKRMIGRSGEPFIREAMRHAMRVLGQQFVLGRTISEALGAAKFYEERGCTFSYDMLGEAARTAADAARYFDTYMEALAAIGADAGPVRDAQGAALFERPGLSVKLSALHPRFEPAKADRVREELLPRVVELLRAAKAQGVSVTIDAEEAERLDLTLDIFASAATHGSLKGWNGVGLAVQAYSKRALPVIEWLAAVARAAGRSIPVRLVKGAYWDAEIKAAQEQGLADYPVFTRKSNTDVSYLACAKLLLSRPDCFYPQFASHNAHTIAAVHALAGPEAEYEFQRLHGMGEGLYEAVIDPQRLGRHTRVYAPVGGHEDLLAYLVRRLLENGSNTSFVHRLADDAAPVEDLIADPVERVARMTARRHPGIPLPPDIFGGSRRNSLGLPLWLDAERESLLSRMEDVLRDGGLVAAPVVGGKVRAGNGARPVTSPHDHSIQTGSVSEAGEGDIEAALSAASAAAVEWDRMGGEARAGILAAASDLFEQHRAAFMAIMVREAGKTLKNAQGDLREAVDFLRYYAAETRRQFAGPLILPGPTGERNELSLHGRGVFACISPWNFPLAIFTGQVSAALAAGNAVVAKPAEQTPLTAALAVRLLHQAGVPGDVLHLLPGDGPSVGAALVADVRVSGVAFTGSNDTAAAINRMLAARGGPIVPLIAETGGINAMIVDSSALPEQVVRDAVTSAFDSAGQRCSALRLLCLQEESADRVLAMLSGAVEELSIGDPMDFATDVGPVIDEKAKQALEAHKEHMRREAKELIDLKLPPACAQGCYVAPAVYEIGSVSALKREVFGPILHVARYRADRLGQLCEAINATGYGLTAGVHTRIESTAAFIASRLRVGNLYINRNQIGAVVGFQPFGGEGLSGTGPKAGGPHTLARFAVERVRSTDLTASGGNAALLSLRPDDRK